MKQIERYIQFAIDNGYGMFEDGFTIEDYLSYHRDIEEQRYQGKATEDIALIGYYIREKQIEDFNVGYYPLLQIITSKEFITAIAKGLIMRDNSTKSEKDITKEGIELLIEDITLAQAIAIRDNKLEEFINNLLQKN